MHARFVLVGVLAVAGCAWDNPAFDERSGSETRGETSQSTSVDSGGVDTADEGQPMACELSGGVPMTIQLAPVCAQDDPTAYDRWFTVLEIVGSTWKVGACADPNCGGCETMTPLPMTFTPLPVGDLAGVGSCLRVSARRRDPTNPDACAYHTVAVWEYANGIGVPILVARNDADVALPLINPAPGPMLSGFSPELVLSDLCPCADYPNDCCDGLAPAPAVFDFDVGLGSHVATGDQTELTLDGVNYDFWALDAYETGICDEPRRVSWALTRK